MRSYYYDFQDKYGCEPASKLTAYGQCEDTLYPEHEPKADIRECFSRGEAGPEMVYICSPLRGNVSENMAKAKEYAREVFLEGNIPICPHVYFPQFASVEDPAENRLAMDMGLSLLKRCSRINVYGDPPTEGMRAEIECAKENGILD